MYAVQPFTQTEVDFVRRICARLDGTATRPLQNLTSGEVYVDTTEQEGDTLVVADWYIRKYVGSAPSILGGRDTIEFAIGEPVLIPGSRDEPDDVDFVENTTVRSFRRAIDALIGCVASNHYADLIDTEDYAATITEEV